MTLAIATPGILAIDLGKFNSVFCRYDPATKAAAYRTLPSTPEHFRAELTREPSVTVVVEVCSPAGWVSDLCGELGLPVVVASTAGDAWS